jgi:hypothetical protein
MDRVAIYNDEGFEFKIYNVNIKGWNWILCIWN